MSNYKIRVNGEAESKEAQELFVVLGYMVVNNIDCEKGYIVVSKNAESPINFDYWHDVKNIITLPQLRDLVVLKRNSIDDANYECNGKKYFLSSTGNNHCWHKVARKGVPVFEWVQCGTPLIPEFKPIEKPVKEYLNKLKDGTYKLVVLSDVVDGHDGLIEIPEGAEIYLDPSCNVYGFYKDNFKQVWCETEWEDTVHNSANLQLWKNMPVLWQRHTLPEELPFIDDEPLQSLNDQYAEIEKVRQTLKTRQDQYGSFEDVAQTTEQLFQVIKGGASFVDFTESQRMALYMIFSKVARLSNGNPNHKDSWHDIAGYATLIDNELVSEKDMPF